MILPDIKIKMMHAMRKLLLFIGKMLQYNEYNVLLKLFFIPDFSKLIGDLVRNKFPIM